jgi:hypothetical protein
MLLEHYPIVFSTINYPFTDFLYQIFLKNIEIYNKKKIFLFFLHFFIYICIFKFIINITK